MEYVVGFAVLSLFANLFVIGVGLTLNYRRRDRGTAHGADMTTASAPRR